MDISASYDRAAIAKDTVKGRYDVYVATYDESMRSAILRQQEITGQMKQALEEGQFEVWLQPQFNHNTGMLFGAEALVRWRHPQEGIISPGEFIPIFERNGFVYEVDRFVWEQSCAMLRKWLDKGLQPVPISVNISRYDVLKDDLIDIITGLVKKYGLPDNLLRLEITESAFSKSSERIIHVVEQLVEMGFIVEIDDFGSGYSSLNTLKDVPAQVLKRDIRCLENDSNAQRGGSIIESVVRMARWLGMSVIAEGVEIVEQANYLTSIGCEYIQGYLYSKPIQVSEYERLYMTGDIKYVPEKIQQADTWNNNAFWNPKSMETLIFNSYVGGACIFEYHNGQTELLRYNNAYAEIFNSFTKKNYLTDRKDILTILDKENAELVKNNIETAIKTKKESTCEASFSASTVSRVYVRVTVRQIAQAGDRSLFYCVVADITAQREAERIEREAAERTSTIMENINAGIAATVIRDGQIHYLFANDRYYELFGYDKSSYTAEFSGSFLTVHKDDKERVMETIARVSTELKEYGVEFRIILKDGSIRWMFCTINLVHLSDIDEPVHLATVNDTTELHIAQRNEQEAAERIRAVMDNAASGITAVILRKDGTAEYLLVNDRYFELVGYTREQYLAEGLKGLELMHSDDLREYEKQIIGLDTVGQTKSFEFRAKRRDGRWIWLRDDIAVISLNGVDSPVQLSCFTDITKRKQSEERLHFINELAGSVLTADDPDEALNNMIVRLMEYFRADRSYIFELDVQHGTSCNTYEVCADGIRSEKDRLQNIPFSETDYWYSTLINRNFFMVDNVEELEDASLRELLSSQSIHSIILAPLWRGGHLIGFAGVDNPAIVPSDIASFTAPADYIALTLSRRDIMRKSKLDHDTILTLMNDTPGGFVRMRVMDDGLVVPEYFNEGFQKLTGMNTDELMAAYGENSMMGVHPDDYEKVDAYRLRLLRDGYAESTRYRIINGNGGYTWVCFNGRVVKDELGDTYLNIYYTDATALAAEEQMQKELIDNLTGGIALYEFDGKSIAVRHINKSYWKLIGREPVDYSDGNGNVTDVIHPDDRAILFLEAESCISQKRDFSCELRVLNGLGEYTAFHVTATVAPEENGKYLFYTTYMPVDRQSISIQDILPIALSTMMETSDDLSFVKNADGRYITCSRTVVDAIGLSSERDIIGKTSAEIFGTEAVRYGVDEDRQIFETGKPMLERLIKLPVKDGRTVIYTTSKYPLPDKNGRVVGIYVICRDVTMEKSMEFEMKTLLRVIPSGVLKYSADEKAEFDYINHSLIESLGYTEEQFKAKFHNRFREMVWRDDLEAVDAEILAQESNGKIGRFDYRVEAADGQLHWFHDEGVKVADESGKEWYYVTLVDITSQKKSEENLRLAEEEYRLATRHSGHTIGRYDIKAQTLTITDDVATRLALPECIPDVPYGRVKLGKISEDTADAYIAFYEDIMKGKKEGSVTFRKLLSVGWRWITEHATTIYDEQGSPVSAIISYKDVTEQQEKELVYKKWQQSIEGRDPNTYTLFRCNLNKNSTFDIWEGSLIPVNLSDELKSFNDRTTAFAEQCVYEDDLERYIDFVNSDTMLAEYHRGHRSGCLEYRGKMADGSIRWLRLTVDLVESPNSTDVEAYLLYESIDEQKKAELEAVHMAETDPLTGLLNRKAFSARVNSVIKKSIPGTRHAFFMLDIDGFKLLNDTFGHAAGDEALVEVAHKLQSMLRKDDILGRLGGDEYVLFLSNVSSEMSIGKKAEHICSQLVKAYSAEIRLTASIGISQYPYDGTDIHTLYERADTALYAAKENGRNTFQIYSGTLPEKSASADMHEMNSQVGESPASPIRKKRMLIVDDSRIDRTVLQNLFEKEFIVDTAHDGVTALSQMRYFGTALSVVLLDLNLKGMSGFEVLEKAQSSPEMHGVPIIVVSGENDSETCMKAIRAGASDYVTKPVQPELIRLRITAAVSRAENERLRAQNSFLQLRDDEISRYRAALNGMGMFVAELDVSSGSFVYDSAFPQHIKGYNDAHPLRSILLSDEAADEADVKRLREFISSLEEDNDRSRDYIEIMLTTTSDDRHRFGINIEKLFNIRGLTQKLIMTFRDLEGS